MSKKSAGKKDLSSKLAGAVRAAKTEHDAETAPGVLPPTTPVHPRTSEEAKVAKPHVTRPRARQSSQVQPSLDDQRGNPHPEERIWPD